MTIDDAAIGEGKLFFDCLLNLMKENNYEGISHIYIVSNWRSCASHGASHSVQSCCYVRIEGIYIYSNSVPLI